MDLNKIKIFDSFLEDDEYRNVEQRILEFKWQYGHTSNGNRTRNEIPFWSSILDNDEYFSVYLFELIKKTLNEPSLKLERVYGNGLTYGQTGVYHVDSDSENARTFMIYVNDIAEEDYDIADGYLYFKHKDLDYNILYEPIKNRGIYFPGNYLHKAGSFSRFIKDMRISIVWKMHLSTN